MNQNKPDNCEPSPKTMPPPRPVFVDVTIVSDFANGTYEMRSPPGSHNLPIKSENGGTPELTFNNNQNGEFAPGFMIRFRLTNRGDSGKYRFRSSLNDALWVKLAQGNEDVCPKEKGNPGGVFDPVDLVDGNRTLVVHNPNKTEQRFGFALNFEAIEPNGKKLTYDPIGSNQNGSAQSS